MKYIDINEIRSRFYQVSDLKNLFEQANPNNICGFLKKVGPYQKNVDTIYQPLRSGRIWHKVNF